MNKQLLVFIINFIKMAVPIVMDFGSAYYKCGFAGDELPKLVEHSLKGSPRHHSTLITPTTLIGDHAYLKKAFLSLEVKTSVSR